MPYYWISAHAEAELLKSSLVFIICVLPKFDIIFVLYIYIYIYIYIFYSLQQEAFKSTAKISGGIEVMFLKYNPDNKILRVNALRAYQLSARDLPSNKADPYFKIGIKPGWFGQSPYQSSIELRK